MTATDPTTTSDAAALLAACAANPDEDTPRLMLADELQDTDPARAEFIRVQCEIAREMAGRRNTNPDALDLYLDPQDRDAQRWKHYVQSLAARERELLAKNEARWRKGPTCWACFGTKLAPSIAVSGPGGSCLNCHGTGDAGELLRTTFRNHGTEYAYPVHFRRGFIERVDVPRLDALVSQNAGDGSVYRPTPWLRAVLDATRAPERALIREVVPLDRGPWESADGRWNWTGRGLPPELFAQAAGLHSTRADAITALGRAVAMWARRS